MTRAYLKLKITILLLTLSFLIVPTSFASLTSSLSDFTDSLQTGITSVGDQNRLWGDDAGCDNLYGGQYFDCRLKAGDDYLASHPETSEADKQAYATARHDYLRAREYARGMQTYVPDLNNLNTIYANDAYSYMSDTNEANNNDYANRINEINQQLADPNLDSATRQALIAERDRMAGVLNNINLANTNNKGIIQDEKRAKAEQSAACLYKWGIHPLNCVLQLTAAAGTLITGIAGTLLWVAGHIFDLSIYLSISTLNSWFQQNTGISSAWKVMRDLANLCFIFILLYIALGTVFELAGMSEPKKLIINVIIIALLVNFSGFITRVVIDSSNIIAYEFYSKMSGPGTFSQDGTGGPTFAGIGWRFVEKLDLTRYYVDTSGSNLQNPQIQRLSFFGIIIQTFGNILLILAATFVLLTASIMFIIRSIYLIFLYIFGPLAFVSQIIPSQSGYFKQWKDKLIAQAFFAPAFLAPLYVVFLILGNGVGTLAGDNGSQSLNMLFGGSIVIIFMDVLIIGLILSCIFIANKMGAAGAKVATAWAGAGTLAGVKGMKYISGKSNFGGSAISRWAQNAKDDNTLHAWGYGPRPNILRRVGAGALGATRNVSAAAQTAWESDTGRAFRQSSFGKNVIEKVKNPLLTASDAIVAVQASMSGGGGGSYSILGKTSSERADAKKKDKENQENERKKQINESLEATLSKLATKDKMTAEKIIQSINEKDTFKLIDPKVFVDFPFAAQALSVKQLQWIPQIASAPLGDIKKAILADPNPTTPPTEAYDFMKTGAGTWMY
jgi:hypothetical protein